MLRYKDFFSFEENLNYFFAIFLRSSIPHSDFLYLSLMFYFIYFKIHR